ncbi:MAG: thiamine phosphate synthase [bacterium]
MLRTELFRLYLITDQKSLINQDIMKFLSHVAESGVKMVQIREKHLPPSELYNLTVQAVELLRPAGVKVLINDRADIALAAGADGIHITSTGMPVDALRRIMPDNAIIGVSTHTLEEAISAEKGGADFVTYGPIFFTQSKAKLGDPVGIERLKNVSSIVKIPIFALGGININNAADCLSAGAFGLAGIGVFQNSPDLSATVNNFVQILEKHARCY